MQVNEGVVVLEGDREGGMHLECGLIQRVIERIDVRDALFIDTADDRSQHIATYRNAGLDVILKQSSRDSICEVVHGLIQIRDHRHADRILFIRRSDIAAECVPAL